MIKDTTNYIFKKGIIFYALKRENFHNYAANN